nr:uncharacterized protein LOC117221366 [Megalopta genalis]
MGFSDFMKWLWSKRMRENKNHKRFLSLVYAFLAWNTVLYAYYQMCVEKNYVTTEDQKAALMNYHKKKNDNIRSIVFHGFTTVKDDTIPKTEEEETKDEKVVGWSHRKFLG